MTTNLIDVLAHSLPAYVWGVSVFFSNFPFSEYFVEWGGRTGLG